MLTALSVPIIVKGQGSVLFFKKDTAPLVS